MKRKRIACLLLAALLVCGLAACSMPSVSAGSSVLSTAMSVRQE